MALGKRGEAFMTVLGGAAWGWRGCISANAMRPIAC
jgi:hypothetical protein